MNRTLIGTTFLASLLAIAATWAGSPPAIAHADDVSGQETNVGGQIRLLKVGIPADGKLGDLLRKNAKLSAGFEVLDRRSIPAALIRSNAFDPKAWESMGADVAILAQTQGSQIRMSLFEVSKGNRAVVSKRYAASDPYSAANNFMNDVVAYYTGEPGVFGSRIAFVRTRRNPTISKNIQTVEMNGERGASVTNNRSLNILPSITPGGQVLYTSYAKRNPDLWISKSGGEGTRLSKYPGLNLGGEMSPDGGSIVLALSKDGNSEIYTLDRGGNIKSRLTNHPGIDGSPSWSAAGQIAFVSNRAGSPQIYRMSASGGAATRVTSSGKYNQSPDWNHGRDRGQWLVYSARDSANRYDIFKIDVRTSKIVRLTQSPGRNLDPSWSPDGRLIAYSRDGGIFVANEDGNNNVQIVRGASNPDWGPRAK